LALKKHKSIFLIMKKITLLVVSLLTAFTFAQGLETFDNLDLEGNQYVDGSFEGNDGITWTYFHVTGQQDFPIDGNGILLRRLDPEPSPSRLFATIEGGIGSFSVDTRKAFTGNNERRLTLLINDEIVGEFVHQFGEGEDDTVVPFEVEEINIEGDFTLEITIGGEDTGNRQIVLDNLTWTGYLGEVSTSDFQKDVFSMYPNPARDFVTINTNSNLEMVVNVYDILGKKVITQTANTLDVSRLKSGVYLVQVTQANNTSVQKLVVR
jgi:hypothetical protein